MLIGDNCNLNNALANLLNLPVVESLSHRFHLVVTYFLFPQKSLIEKFNKLIGKLKSFKFSAMLRDFSKLVPIQKRKQDSQAPMKCYLDMMFLNYSKPCFNNDNSIKPFLLSSRKSLEIQYLLFGLAKFNPVNLLLQTKI